MSTDKTIKRDELAQDIMDLYYQDFKEDNEGFFDIDFFIRQVNDVYSSLLKEQYTQGYAILRQSGEEMAEIVRFDEQFLRSETIEISNDDESGNYIGKLKGSVFSFPFDTSNVAIQHVVAKDCDFIRSKMSKRWMKKFLPKTKIVRWWPTEPGTILFDKDCCKKVKVFYVASADDKLEMQEGFAAVIKQTILQLMIGARDGTIVDTTNDSNKNKTIQTEINPER